MIIQAGHMSFGFDPRAQAEKSRTGVNSLLPETAGGQLASGMNVNLPEFHDKPPVRAINPDVEGQLPEQAPETIGQTIANEIVRRMGGEGDAEALHNLRHGIGSSMDWVRERFGEEAATAAGAMLLGSTSNGVTEDSLSDGLLNGLRFIDRNFGIAAGDAAIAKYNGNLNEAINDYFDNGQSELFMATLTPVDGQQLSASADVKNRFIMRAAENLVPDPGESETLAEQLLGALKSEMDKVAELQDLTTQLEAQFNPAKAQQPTATMDAALAAYGEVPVPAEPQITSISV